MIDKGYWIVLPYPAVQGLPNLRISPLGVVPQRERRPRIIVDLSFSGVNRDTAKLAPPEAMQFGCALSRILSLIQHAPPKFGPVYLLKLDIADGFYQVYLHRDDIPALGVVLPAEPDQVAPLIAFPLALPMGWTESPPFFCCLTETATDLANQALATSWDPPRHPLETLADAKPQNTPNLHDATSTPSAKDTHAPLVRRGAPVTRELFAHLRSQRHHPTEHGWQRRPLATVDVFVDDHVALGQGSRARLNRTRRILLHAIDAVFRPNDAQDRERCDPISHKKLRKGDGAWNTRKTVLGWIIDTTAGTIELPPHRRERLRSLLHTFLNRKRANRNAWQSFLGELRSMALGIPGIAGFFSQLQAVLQRPTDRHRL